MTGMVDWAAGRARMVIAFILLSILAGAYAYASLPKEGEPDIEIPAVVISLPFPGISAADAEELLVKPMEAELKDIDGLDTMTSTAAEGYANVVLEFEFGWDKGATLAEVRDAMSKAEARFPAGFDQYSISEFNFSEFPILIVSLSGAVPERTLLRTAKDLQERLEGLGAVLNAELAGHRDEMIEVEIDPLRMESYNVTAGELLNVVRNNNALVAAGEIEGATGANSIKIDGAFDEPTDVYDLPVKVNGDRVVTLGDIADIRLTFEDRAGTARFDGEPTVAVQVVKRKGFNLIDTVAEARATVADEVASWPTELRDAITVTFSNDTSREVESMVGQLEGSVLTAVALVMIVVLATLGPRSAFLVGFSIPTSFLLCFAFLALMGVSISNIVMFGLILAVGMLVDGAIVVVEYADKRLSEGAGPMTAYTEAAKRMFWPIVSSTATTLCAFLPMLFWPGVAGQFMGMLPVTLIFVLSASLVVALIYLPVMGGVAGRLSRVLDRASDALRARLPWVVRAMIVPPAVLLLCVAALQVLNPTYLFDAPSQLVGQFVGVVLFVIAMALTAIAFSAARIERAPRPIRAGHRRTLFGRFIALLVKNPIMPVVTAVLVVGFVGFSFVYYGGHNNGTDFFVETEPEQAIIYVRARGNLSLTEKDDLLRQAEAIVMRDEGIRSAFAFAGAGGLNANTGGAGSPLDTIGQIQIEMIPWDDREAYAASGATSLTLAELDGNATMARLQDRLATLPGIRTEVTELAMGPGSAKPVHLRLEGDDLDAVGEAARMVRDRFAGTPGLIDIEDTLPLPGIDWQLDVDVEKAGRYGADVTTVGAMVQLITRGLLLDTMRVDSSDEEIDIRVRFPSEFRLLSTLDTLKVRTPSGLIPLANFVTREPVAKLARINRIDETRYYDVKAAVAPDLFKLPDGTVVPVAAEAEPPVGAVAVNGNERIAALTEWLDDDPGLPQGVAWEWTGEQQDQEESGAFLQTAFMGALALMFIILLAQFDSFYNSALVLTAVVMSVAGALWGMIIMGQPFSIIMTGTGIVALAGIVVNNNIVLIDTYQDYSRYMPKLEAIVQTAEDRIRPVLLTTITTMAGLAPMMFGLSIDFFGGGYTIDSPTALWWKSLATAVVFGLGLATVLTLVFTPTMLALRVWAGTIALWLFRLIGRYGFGRTSRVGQDWVLRRKARKAPRGAEIVWDDPRPEPVENTPESDEPEFIGPTYPPLRAAE